MAKIKSGSFILDSGEKILFDNIYIDQTTASGFLTIHASGYYYGDGTNLTGMVRNFTDFSDSPSNYTSAAGRYLQVNSTADGVEFSTFSGTAIDSLTKTQVNTISGSLQDQIDAIMALPPAGGIDKAGITTLTSGIDSLSINYGAAFASIDYTISVSMSNIVDAIPSIYSCTISAKTVDGFTVSFSGDIDSSNYNLEWIAVSSGTGSAAAGEPDTSRGIFGGGYGSVTEDTIDYITISTTGDATDFGDLTVSRYGLGPTSNGTNERGVFGGGYHPDTNTIDHITISTTGDATDFGDLTVARAYLAATSNGTNERGVFGGGTGYVNIIDYVTISTTGNATDFGDLTVIRGYAAATSNGTNERGVFAGGASPTVDTIDYITISTTGNATDFGDMTVSKYDHAATSNTTNERGVFGGDATPTNVIEYVTISTPGNATDFGDMTITRNALAATSNGTNERGVFGGGNNSVTDTMDYIVISTTGDATDFGDLTVARYYLAATSNA